MPANLVHRTSSLSLNHFFFPLFFSPSIHPHLHSSPGLACSLCCRDITAILLLLVFASAYSWDLCQQQRLPQTAPLCRLVWAAVTASHELRVPTCLVPLITTVLPLPRALAPKHTSSSSLLSSPLFFFSVLALYFVLSSTPIWPCTRCIAQSACHDAAH